MTKKLMLLGLAAMCGSAQNWTEFSIGPAVKSKTSFGRDGLRSEGMPLIGIVWRAYGMPVYRIAGPDWMATERYAITALVAHPSDFQPLMQLELAKRFYLATHRELRDVPSYSLRAVSGTEAKREARCPAMPPGTSYLSYTTTAAKLAEILADFVQRPVIDETGITGDISVCVQWKGSAAAVPAAVREQIGLEMVEGNATTEFLVVDHVEKLRVTN